MLISWWQHFDMSRRALMNNNNNSSGYALAMWPSTSRALMNIANHHAVSTICCMNPC
jgi:hypothetical protein